MTVPPPGEPVTEGVETRYEVRVVVAEPDGSRRSRLLWDLPDIPTAGNAALGLVRVLGSIGSGLVVLDEQTQRVTLLSADNITIEGPSGTAADPLG